MLAQSQILWTLMILALGFVCMSDRTFSGVSEFFPETDCETSEESELSSTVSLPVIHQASPNGIELLGIHALQVPTLTLNHLS